MTKLEGKTCPYCGVVEGIAHKSTCATLGSSHSEDVTGVLSYYNKKVGASKEDTFEAKQDHQAHIEEIRRLSKNGWPARTISDVDVAVHADFLLSQLDDTKKRADIFEELYRATSKSFADLEKASLDILQQLENVEEKRAPVQGYSASIPWSMHLRAYDEYCKKWRPQEALIDLEGRNCRGGFHVDELDEFIPGWREELSEMTKLKVENEHLKDAFSNSASVNLDLIKERENLKARVAELEKED